MISSISNTNSPRSVSTQLILPTQTPNYTPANALNADVFQLTRSTSSQNNNISFGSIRKKDLLNLIKQNSDKLEGLETSSDITKSIDNYFVDLKAIFNKYNAATNSKNKIVDKNKQDFSRVFGHELRGRQAGFSQLYTDPDIREYLVEFHPSVVLDEAYLALQKQQLKKMFKFASGCVKRYEHLNVGLTVLK